MNAEYQLQPMVYHPGEYARFAGRISRINWSDNYRQYILTTLEGLKLCAGSYTKCDLKRTQFLGKIGTRLYRLEKKEAVLVSATFAGSKSIFNVLNLG